MKSTRNAALLLSLAALLVSCATQTDPQGAPLQTVSQGAPPLSDILGVRLDMPRDSVRTVLANMAKLEREERRRQEVWTLSDDPRFASLIIGYTKEWNVRFVTAVARPDGMAVHYEDVLDVATAEHRAAGQTNTYTSKIGTTGTPPYFIIAIGKPERIEYLSLKREPQS